MGMRNELYLRGMKALMTEHNMNVEEANELINDDAIARVLKSRQGLSRAMRNPIIEQINSSCSETVQPQCRRRAKYRTLTGECNNFRNPFWGAQNIAMRRYLPPRYADDMGEPLGRSASNRNLNRIDDGNRMGKSQGKGEGKGKGSGKGQGKGMGGGKACKPSDDLPSPRTVSRRFHKDRDLPDNDITLMVMQFGQFLDHDITLTPETHSDIDCCEEGNENEENCFAIRIRRNDPFFIIHQDDCLEFTRSEAFCMDLSGKREQFNSITAFIDASNVYGSDADRNGLLRTLSNGMLSTNSTNESNKDLLPIIDGRFTGGDIRAVEMPGLTSMHTLFLREHNRIAKEISDAEPSLSDEEVFFKARHIVGAEMQNIVYGQFLPVVLGTNTVEQCYLDVSTRSEYDRRLDPSVFNAFATAAYRFGHTLIQGGVNMRDLMTRQIRETYLLR